MKVAVLTLSVSQKAAGMLDCVRQLCFKLTEEQEVDLDIFAIRDSRTAEETPAWAPLPLRLFDPKGPANFGYSSQIPASLDEANPDIAHTHGLWTYFSAASHRWSRKQNRPSIVTPQGMLDPWALNHSRLKKKVAAGLFERGHLANATCLHAVCTSEAESMRAYGLRNPIAIVPNGVILPSPNEEATCEPPWRLPNLDGRKTLLFLGRLHPKKGLPNLLRAWSQVKRDQPALANGWRLIVAGWEQGGHLEELRTLVAELSLADAVHFVGPMFNEAKTRAYRSADAFVLPSFSEGLPLAVLEAWSYRRPVLITPQCNLPEGLEAGAALQAEPDPESLAAALTQLFAAPAKDLCSMGAKGRTLVERKFTWSRAARAMREVYDWTVGGGARPDCVDS